MQVHYGEDIASHAGPAPCVVFREGQGEASAGERAGWPLSRVRPKSRVPEPAPAKAGGVTRPEGNTPCRAIASGGAARRGQRPQHARTLLVREPRDLILGQWREPLVRVGKVRSRSRRCTRLRSQTWP